jgi:pimeloyl-ACP methyl ester carboxylesterase
MPATKRFPRKHWIWIGVLLALVLIVTGAYLWPAAIPESEGPKLREAAANYEIVVLFDSGGWGETKIEDAPDFAPILKGIQEKLSGLGYSSTIVLYTRTPSGFSGRIYNAKEWMHDFQRTAELQAEDIRYLLKAYPQKQILLVGFSNGGALASRTLHYVPDQPRLHGIVVGAPGWFEVYTSPACLILNNSGKDTLSIPDYKTMAINVIKAPFKWIWAKITGKDLKFAMAFQFPYHEYPWESSEVGLPITRFLESCYPSRK